MRLGAGYSSPRDRLGLPGRNHIRNQNIQKLPCSTTVCAPPLCPRRAHLHDPQSYAPRSTAKLAPQRNRVTHAQTQKSFCGRFRRTNLHSQLRDSSAQPTSPSTSQRINNTCIARFTIRGFRDPRNQSQPVLHSSLQGKTRNRHGVDHIPVNTEGRIRTRDPKRHRH